MNAVVKVWSPTTPASVRIISNAKRVLFPDTTLVQKDLLSAVQLVNVYLKEVHHVCNIYATRKILCSTQLQGPNVTSITNVKRAQPLNSLVLVGLGSTSQSKSALVQEEFVMNQSAQD